MKRDELVNKIVSSPVYSRDSGLVVQLATALRNKLSLNDLDQLLLIIGTKTKDESLSEPISLQGVRWR